jgi:hypothetical protein
MIEIKAALKKVIDERLGEPLVEELLLTNMLELPIDRLTIPAYPVSGELAQTDSK